MEPGCGLVIWGIPQGPCAEAQPLVLLGLSQIIGHMILKGIVAPWNPASLYLLLTPRAFAGTCRLTTELAYLNPRRM